MEKVVCLRLRSGNNIHRLVSLIRKHPLETAILLVVAVFVFLRIWRVNLPGETVFDEVYFPKMAHQYLIGEKFFDIHPPLGKLLIALGELALGNTTLGWRIVSLLADLAILPVAYWVMRTIFGSRGGGIWAAFLIAIDGMMIVYSRTGLMDGMILLFGLTSLGFCWKFRKARLAGQQAWIQLILTGFFAGLAVAVKWIGVGFLPLVAATTFITFFANRTRPVKLNDILIWLFAMVVLPALLYTLPFLANWQSNFWTEFIRWHQQSWGYNVHLNATHPYASKWWSWPFLIRPIWFYYKNIDGKVVGVDGIGNPLVWWGATLAVVYTIMVLVYSLIVWHQPENQVIKRSDFWSLLFLIAGWAIFYLPWSTIGRVLFLYHYLTSYLFALLLSAYWLEAAMAGRISRFTVIIAAIATVVVALFFAPIWIAYPISQDWFNHLMWFKSWI